MVTESALFDEFDEKEKILVESLSYIRLDDPIDWYTAVVNAHNIEPLSAEKRIRVYSDQLLYTIIENVTLRNYLYEAGIYYIYGENLREKYPEHEKQILHAYLVFWQELQSKLKKLPKK